MTNTGNSIFDMKTASVVINSAYRMENLLAWRYKVTVLLFSDERRQMKFVRALHRDSVNRMAFCMRMRCWCGGNVQGVCPSFILALLISVFFTIFHMESTWEYTGVLFNSFLIASDGKEKMWASADYCKPSDFCVMSERTRRQYGGLLCVRVQI